MKDRRLAFGYVIAFILPFLVLFISQSEADTGHEGAARVEIGSYVETASITGTSRTPTALFSESIKRPDGLYFNNTASAIWISTVATSVTVELGHPAVAIGYPILSSATFRLEGSMTGSMTFICDGSAGTCNVRKLEGLVR